MAVSLTLVISAAIALSAIVAAIIAFTPTYTTGADSIADTVGELRENIIVKARIGAEKFMMGPATSLASFSQHIQDGLINVTTIPDEAKQRIACDLVLRLDSVEQFTWMEPDVGPDDVVGTACDDRASLKPPGQTVPSIAQTSNASHFAMYEMDPVTRLADRTKPTGLVFRFPRALMKNPAYSAIDVRKGKGKPVWLDEVTAGLDSANFVIGFSLPDKYGNNESFVTLKVIPTGLTRLLKSLDLRQRARALIFDANSKIVLANNWNETNEKQLEHYLDVSRPASERLILKTVTNYSDPLLNDVLNHYGGASKLLNLPLPLADTVGSGKDKVFVNLQNITDEYGLNMRVLILMPELDFMENAYKSRDMTIGIIIACLCVMVGLAILFSIAITKPIDRVGERMYKTASLQDDDSDDSPSLLAEVRDMQNAYTTMRSELNRMKTYLPQSVLVAADDDEGELTSHESSHRSSTKRGSEAGRTANSSESSMRSIVKDKSGNVTVGLNVATGCTNKVVVVAVFNLSNLHGKLKKEAQSNAMAAQSNLLSTIDRHCRENKGIVDSFQGDHVIVTFNAVSNVACPTKRAVSVALRVCQELAKDPSMPSVSVGIGYGPAVVGNTGSATIQRFNVIGPVYVHAMAAERLASQTLKEHKRPWLILATAHAVSELQTEFLLQNVDIVHLPISDGDVKTCRMYSVEGAKNMSESEWMYQLEEGERADPFCHVNAAFDLIADQKMVEAQVELSKRPDTKDVPDQMGSARALELIQGAEVKRVCF